MGYYTLYNLSMQDKHGDDLTQNVLLEVNMAFSALPYFENVSVRTNETAVLSQSDFINDHFLFEDLKWYDFESDMIELSKKFPDIRFTLRGEGEDGDDRWIEYFFGGKSQSTSVKFVFDDCTLW